MFKTCSPESAGIPSKKVLKFIKALELQCLNLKNIILKALMQWMKQERSSVQCNYLKAYLYYGISFFISYMYSYIYLQEKK